NLFQVFISWELVGVCSYLLIGFYFERQSASNAANKAFITNRIGDAGFIIGLLILWTHVGTFNFEEIFTRLRAPSVDSHDNKQKPATFAAQIVRANPVAVEDPKSPKRYVMLAQDAPSSGETQAVLFPLHMEHYHNVQPGTAFTSPRYGVMPYWMLV